MLKLVTTENGLVRGFQGNNTRISVFKGIPFAAPPIGENRWRAPQPCASWEGVRECGKFAPISIQDLPGVGTDIYCREWHVDKDIEMDEDCLYLNVWTPAMSDKDNLPVFIWFFGGGFQWGYPREMEFNGENIAKRGVIVVSVNYRLGAIGFLSHPDLIKESPEAPANFGTLDQQAGIKWVIRNIANFGGDPKNITIAGQSAGGGSVLTHLTSESSIGLYQKAIVYSGIIENPYIKDSVITPKPIEETCQMGEKFIESLGVSSIEEARKIDAHTIKEKYAEFREKNMFFFTPCIDHVFLKDEPFKLLLTGKQANVPILAGNTYDEFKSFLVADSKESFETQAKEVFGDRSSLFLSFPESYETEDGNKYGVVRGIECSVKAALDKTDAPCFYYSFEVDIPGEDDPGTFHSVDLWFFFETLAACWRPFVGRHYDIARRMTNYITNFIKNGNPNGEDITGEAMPKWLAYSDESRNEMHFTADGCVPKIQDSEYIQFFVDYLRDRTLGTLETAPRADASVASLAVPLRKQAFNPYLPSWEYIPDGEPYVFGNRLYIYGSHDYYNCSFFCPGDYVSWSAPLDNLADWRYEGVSFKRTDDPDNQDNKGCLYAPDVTVGPDGAYYLFYVLDNQSVVAVAKSDKPQGPFKFYGHVHYADGTLLGKKEGDEPQFDPGVITIGETTYLYTGFCGQTDASRHGAMVTLLDKDMLTIKKAPSFIVPGTMYAGGTEFEGHAFFEAPSIRERNGIYYFIYSSQVMHELCYATSSSPEGPFTYGGVIVSNCDLGIDSYKEACRPSAYGANNHGSMVEINGEWYIFYHRHTNNTWYSRQGCAEKLTFTEDGAIHQVEMTSCGLNGGPLRDTDEYPSYIACNIFSDKDDKKNPYVGQHKVARVIQDGRDGDHETGYITSISEGTTIGFKYFDLKNAKGIRLYVRGYGNGTFEVRTSIGGPVLAELPVNFMTVWEKYEADFSEPITDPSSALYLTYKGGGDVALRSFKFIHE